MYQQIEPLDPRDAFEVVASPDHEATQAAAQSQAALLMAARSGVIGASERELSELEEEASGTPFTLPNLRAIRREHRLKVADATRPLSMSKTELVSESPEAVQGQMASVVEDLYDKPDTQTAAALFEAGMESQHPLVRVAAAAGARETTRSRRQILGILHEGIESDDPTTRELATAALGHINRKDPELQRHLALRPQSYPRDRESNTAVITHGTWGSDQGWYQPAGSFHRALDTNRPDLDLHDQSFEWSGSYTHTGRKDAADDLKQWIGDQGLNRPDFLAHSHGVTVANLATRAGVEFNHLVYLAWPVHEKWYPDAAKVHGTIIDIRVKLDLVIMLDRGGQRIRGAPFPVTEHRNGWFDHSSVHEPEYWDDHGLWGVI